MRKCTKCETDKSNKWYRGPLCSKCYSKRWSRENKTKTKEYSKKWKNNNPDKEKARHLTPKSRFTNSKNSAMARGKIWNISFEDFQKLIVQPCSYCNNEIGSINSYGSGLDRIDNSIDYTLDNVIPCCKICNSTRNNYFSIEETKIAIQAIIAFRKSRVVL